MQSFPLDGEGGWREVDRAQPHYFNEIYLFLFFEYTFFSRLFITK